MKAFNIEKAFQACMEFYSVNKDRLNEIERISKSKELGDEWVKLTNG